MAEKDTYQQTADEEKEDAALTVTDKGSVSDEQIQDGTDGTVGSEDSSSSSEPPNRKTKTASGEDIEQVDIKEGSFSPDEDCTQPQVDDKCHGDCNEEATAEYHTGRKKEPEVTTQQTQGDREGDQVDRPKETSGANNDTEAGDDDNSGVMEISTQEEEKEETTCSETTSTPGVSVEKDSDEKRPVERIGPATQDTETTVQVDHGAHGGSWKYLILVVAAVLVAIMVQHLQPESPPEKKDVRHINIFLNKMDKLKAQFPHQRAELWKRSQIHLLKHLQCAQPTEPVSLILTAGLRAQRTLRCLAQGLASAFSSALNASVLHIDGASKASQDSDQVKLDLDSTLQGAFEGDKPVAVIHRFEELPPGSTLIFYRYCDHENAAYKKTCLIFTVLLEEEEEIPAKSHLSVVEEMVDDHLQKKFLSDGHPVSFDRMDLDKYGGLWSRISHLILPVAAEERIEHDGCEGT